MPGRRGVIHGTGPYAALFIAVAIRINQPADHHPYQSTPDQVGCPPIVAMIMAVSVAMICKCTGAHQGKTDSGCNNFQSLGHDTSPFDSTLP
jgi:hypothetical protein